MPGSSAESLEMYLFPESAVGTKFSDTLEIDQEARRLYMSNNWTGGVDVFDISGDRPVHLKTVRIRGLMYGIAIAKPVGKTFVGLGGSMVAVIDIDPDSDKYHTLLTRIDTGGRGNTDLIDFDPVHTKIYAANRNDGFMVAINAVDDTVVGRIEGLGGGLEQPRYNPADGMVYLAGNVDNVLYQVDPETDTLVNTFDIVDACHPNGMAINPTTNQAILACSNRQHPHAVLWDFATQKVATVIEDCGPGDGAAYAASVDRFFFAGSDAPGGPSMAIIGGDPVALIENVPTKDESGWAAFDDVSGRLYAPAIQEGRPALLWFTVAR